MAIIWAQMGILFAFFHTKQYLCGYFKQQDMELKCPQCGKWMAVSQEELLIHDCQVVCPQCLAVCQYENGGLVVRDDSDAPFRHNAIVDNSKTEATAKFCHSCGKKLPEGISFCPYCGADLSIPFEEPKAKPAVAPAPETPREPEPVVRQEHKETPKKEPQPVEQHVQTAPRMENTLRNMPRHYSSMHPKLQQHGTLPSRGFKIFAYIAIFLLLLLLVFIIIAGANIEPSM